MEITKELAAQIVTAIYEVVKRDINFIDPDGRIIGSSDQKRIGDFHQAGAYAAKEKKRMIVDEEHPFEGARPGINYPIFLENQVLGVIGITGDPKELDAYGFLITKITEVFLKEQKLNEELLSKDRALQYLIQSLIHGDLKDPERMKDLMEEFGIDETQKCQVLRLKIRQRGMEPVLRFFFREKKIQLSLYNYPREWVAILTEKEWKRLEFPSFLRQHPESVFAGIGEPESLYQLQKSYENARTASQRAERMNQEFCSFEEISAEMILESVKTERKRRYAEQILGKLKEKEKELLQIYFRNNQSLKETAEELGIHRNTLQYQLDQIAGKCGKNPREFQEAFQLQLALLCEDSSND